MNICIQTIYRIWGFIMLPFLPLILIMGYTTEHSFKENVNGLWNIWLQTFWEKKLK